MTSDRASSLPRREFLPLNVKPLHDRFGFVSVFQDSSEVGDLFAFQLVLVVAPPWTGKSFVAKQLDGHFRQHIEASSKDAPFGAFFHLTNFERGMPVNAVPDWWDAWRESELRACWIVDAIDEDATLFITILCFSPAVN